MSMSLVTKHVMTTCYRDTKLANAVLVTVIHSFKEYFLHLYISSKTQRFSYKGELVHM